MQRGQVGQPSPEPVSRTSAAGDHDDDVRDQRGDRPAAQRGRAIAAARPAAGDRGGGHDVHRKPFQAASAGEPGQTTRRAAARAGRPAAPRAVPHPARRSAAARSPGGARPGSGPAGRPARRRPAPARRPRWPARASPRPGAGRRAAARGRRSGRRRAGPRTRAAGPRRRRGRTPAERQGDHRRAPRAEPAMISQRQRLAGQQAAAAQRGGRQPLQHAVAPLEAGGDRQRGERGRPDGQRQHRGRERCEATEPAAA